MNGVGAVIIVSFLVCFMIAVFVFMKKYDIAVKVGNDHFIESKDEVSDLTWVGVEGPGKLIPIAPNIADAIKHLELTVGAIRTIRVEENEIVIERRTKNSKITEIMRWHADDKDFEFATRRARVKMPQMAEKFTFFKKQLPVGTYIKTKRE